MIGQSHYFKLKALGKHYLRLWNHRFFNPVVRQQLKNVKRIPIIIISYNQLNYLKSLIELLLSKGYSNIVIIDNNSTFMPLLDYFEEIESNPQITIHILKENLGHLCFWKHKELHAKYSKGYYVVTDPDILPVEHCPEDFMCLFLKLLDNAYDRTKVGFSLKIDDIPDTNPNKEKIINWESKYWTSAVHLQAFKAEIDTTFALYRPGYKYKLKHFTKAWRTKYPFQARHGGWYIDINNLTEEQRFYMKTANASASWQIDEKGDLINKVHKPLYLNEE